jgi:leucyl aminopeptidase
VKIEFVNTGTSAGPMGILAVRAFEGAGPSPALEALDLAGKVARLIERGRFQGRLGEVLTFLMPAGIDADSVLVAGAGAQDAWGARSAELWSAHAYAAVKASGARRLMIDLEGCPPEVAAHAALGMYLAAYRFDKYRTCQKPEAMPTIETATIVTDDATRAEANYKDMVGLAEGIYLARDLVSEPANVLYPVEFARRVKELSRVGLSVEVLGEAELEKLGMGALLGVGQGSVRESQLVVIMWHGAKDTSAPPVAFVGKGVCFDTGGISIKPADDMEEMIIDMAGAAAVTGAMYALAARRAKVNAVGILGLVENMPDGAAQRPGDIVKTMSGQTVEVINTDAEGRLVLADALWYCQDRFKPRLMIDLATLTGAMITALGTDICGVFSNDSHLMTNLLSAASASNDRLWHMPLPEDYEKALESRAADIKHVGDKSGGAITAALFLKRFVNDVPWAHLDVGLTVWKPKSSNPTMPDGATGFGVRLLDRLMAEFYEDKP